MERTRGIIYYKKQRNIMITNITADILQKYVETNEVVFQFCGELVEVSNDTEKENKETLIRYLRSVFP